MTNVFRHLPGRRAFASPSTGSLAGSPPGETGELPHETETAGIPETVSGATATLLNYAYLQVLDLLTTSAFLLAGVREANPLVLLAIRMAPNALWGLAMVKLLAVLLGMYCWRTSRVRLLRAATAFYAVLVAYNLVCLILGLAVR